MNPFLYLFELAHPENQSDEEKIAQLVRENDFIFRIGAPNKSYFEKLHLLTLKLIILIWEQGDTEDLEAMEKKLDLIDDIRHELTFIRAKYYKKIFEKKVGLKF